MLRIRFRARGYDFVGPQDLWTVYQSSIRTPPLAFPHIP